MPRIKNSELKNHKDFKNGHIYLLTVENDKGIIKKYVGQAKCFTTNGKNKNGEIIYKKYGYKVRWSQHKYEAKTNKGFCRVLDNAIRKYGEDNFKVELLETISLKKLNEREGYFIKLYNSNDRKYGYNISSGGDACVMSEETKQKISKKMIGKNKGNILPKRKRKNSEENDLPKYIRKIYRKRKNKNGDISYKDGYRVQQCPDRKDKGFLDSIYTNEQKLNFAITYIKTGNYPGKNIVLNPTSKEDFQQMKVGQLIAYCKTNNIKKYSKKQRTKLIEHILNWNNK